MIIVADTGPIVHLYWIDASPWALPPQTIHIVDPVWDEVRRHAPEALRDSRLKRVSVRANLPQEIADLALDEGERAALSYAMIHKPRGEVLVLCDEHAARAACSRLRIAVTGYIGLIVEAVRAGRISIDEAATALRDLPGRGRLHASSELIRIALEALEQS